MGLRGIANVCTFVPTKKIKNMKLEIGTQITERHGGKVVSIKKVSRVTNTSAFVKSGTGSETRLKIESDKDGMCHEIGADKWSQYSYYITTDQDRAEFKHALVVQKLKNTEWGKLPQETVFKILELLKPTI
jgi:hypothetical protein